MRRRSGLNRSYCSLWTNTAWLGIHLRHLTQRQNHPGKVESVRLTIG